LINDFDSKLYFVLHQFKKKKIEGAPQDLSERIAGGSLATEGEFPYIASVQLERRHYCSGMIYNDRWILTAASCVSG
jgi:secreted trypsin-like serine protease